MKKIITYVTHSHNVEIVRSRPVPICSTSKFLLDFSSNRMVFVYPLVEKSTIFMAACLSSSVIHLLPTVLEATKRVRLPTESAGHAWLCQENCKQRYFLSLVSLLFIRVTLHSPGKLKVQFKTPGLSFWRLCLDILSHLAIGVCNNLYGQEYMSTLQPIPFIWYQMNYLQTEHGLTSPFWFRVLVNFL